MSLLKNAFFNNDYLNDFNATIIEGAEKGMNLRDIILLELQEFRGKPRQTWMKQGEAYYMNRNEINDYGRNFVIPEERNTLADNRLSNPFMKKLVDQKVGYLLGKPIVSSSENTRYEELWQDLMNQKFDKTMKTLGKEAINKGIGWMYVYIDEFGEFSYTKLRSENLVPIWADELHTVLDGAIHFYDVIVYDGKKRNTVTRVEYYDKEMVHFYVYDGIELIEDVERGVRRGHLQFTFNGTEEEGGQKVSEFGWGRVPLIAFKYNEEEQPLLQFLKSLIDDYDRQKSINANNIEDLPNSIYAVYGYGGSSPAEVRKNLALYRIIMIEGSSTGEKAGVESVNIKIDTEAYKNHIEQSRKDIYEFGRGVDTQGVEIGSSASGIALKFLYSDLALDMSMMETEFQSSLLQLKYFFDLYLSQIAREGDFAEEHVEFIFNKDMPIDEEGIIEAIRNSVGIISNETLIENHPYVSDVVKEMNRVNEEKTAIEPVNYGGLPNN